MPQLHKHFNVTSNPKMAEKLETNSAWFDFYTKELDTSPKDGYKGFDKYFLCPCCYFPTLTERQGFEICPLCNWEDDGQDNHNADKVLGGPNQSYSLTEARHNFKKYFTSYRPSDSYHFQRTTEKKTIDGKIISDLVEIKKQIIEKYNLAMATESSSQRTHIFNEISKLESKLR
jgi:hypothetical protein